MNGSLNSLKGGYVGCYIGGIIIGDTRSLDYGSHRALFQVPCQLRRRLVFFHELKQSAGFRCVLLDCF